MPVLPLLGLCGCDCGPAACQGKSLIAFIPSQATPDDTGSFCPGTFDCSGPDGCVTTCAAVANMVAWLVAQFTNFQNNTLYPWDTVTTAYFTDPSATTPSSIVGPTTDFPGLAGGSGYTNNGVLVASDGPPAAPAGSICATAYLTAMNMSGNLFINPYDVPSVTEPCLMTAPGPYYIPMPPFDLCATETEGISPLTNYAIEYVLQQTGNSDDCLPGYSGGAYTTCQTPDPFFGSDPP
jgi:hypothetical protein